RTEIGCLQGKARSGPSTSDFRWFFQTGKLINRVVSVLGLCCVDAYISPGKQGTQSRDAADTQTGPDYPKTRAFLDNIIGPLAIELGLNQYFGPISGHFNAAHHSDAHIFIADLG